jgi:hypothetical protein
MRSVWKRRRLLEWMMPLKYLPNRRASTLFLAVALLFIVQAAGVRAHPMAPSLLEVTESETGWAEVTWKTPITRTPGWEMRPRLPSFCKPVDLPTLERVKTGIVEKWEVECSGRSLEGATIDVEGIDRSRTDVLLRVSLADGRSFRTVLRPASPSFVVPERERARDVMKAYVRLGFEHILAGIDHLLFVLGLIVLVKGGRKLIGVITAFTLGHSSSLSLAALGWIRIPSTPVDLLIAMSIFILGVELLRDPARKPGLVRRYPWAMTTGFGFLHGLGFAGALVEVGLPAGEIPLALFSFNVGIEIGQLLFVFVVLLNGAALRLLAFQWPSWSTRATAYAVGSLASFWLVDRIVLIFS